MLSTVETPENGFYGAVNAQEDLFHSLTDILDSRFVTGALFPRFFITHGLYIYY